MTDSSDRIPCPSCGSNNFPSSQTCWSCGQPLTMQTNGTPPPDNTPGTPPPYQPGPPPPAGPGAPYPPSAGGNTQIFIILGYIFAGMALLPGCCGWPFGIAGIVMGVIALTRGDKRGTPVIIASVAAIVISLVVWTALGAAFRNNIPNWMPRDMQPAPPSGGYTPPTTIP